jgi:hypothetical protein
MIQLKIENDWRKIAKTLQGSKQIFFVELH